jgi:lysozyme
MNVTDEGIDLIVAFEGLVPYAYNDPVGHCTFGVGHLIHEGRCTPEDYRKFGRRGEERPHAKQRARRILRDDLNEFEREVARLVRGSTRQREFNAMVSLAFNIGVGALKGSSVRRLHNLRLGFLAGRAFMKWTKATDPDTGEFVELPGLVRRRDAERKLYRGRPWR